MHHVAVITGNFDSARYSYKAYHLLKEYGYDVYPVAPFIKELEGDKVFQSITGIPVPVETVSLYMKPNWVETIISEIIAKQPLRVIFNPGTESIELENKLKERNIRPIRACTLVLLKTGQFEKV